MEKKILKVYALGEDGIFCNPKFLYFLGFQRDGLLVRHINALGFIGHDEPWIIPYENIETICRVELE